MQKGMLIAAIIAFGRWAILLLSSALSKLQGWVREFMVWSISAGPMPAHIAFIMDGNRRFADRIHVDRPIGHSHGYEALLGTLKDCFDLRVKVVTLFAFSIDNFYRPSDEVSALMELMESKLEALVEKQGLASEYGIRVRVLGDLHLLPEGVRRAAEKAMSVTKHNNSLVLNICVSYTATHEIVRSIQQTCNNFLSACNVCCGDVVDLLHEASYRCSNEVCNNADEENSCHVLENGSHAVQGGKGGNDELAGYNNGEVSDTESKVADKAVIFSMPATCNGIDCGGLRRRSQCDAGDSNNSAIHKTSVDVCSSSHSHMVGNGGVRRNGVSSREVENDSKAFEVTHSCIDTTYQGLISHITSPKGFHCPRHVPSREEQTEMDFLSTRNLMNSCCLNDRILKVAEDCISEEEIEKNLYTYPCPPPDLLIRTSGETRLSNFLLWQSSFSHLAFCKVLWPEFSFRHLFFIILDYQRDLASLLKKRQHYSSELWRNH